MAKRVQRTRIKGGGMPAGAVYVGRPSKWGNPFVPSQYDFEDEFNDPAEEAAEKRKCAVRDFRSWLIRGLLPVTVEDVRRELRGKDLACWCPVGSACHADVLLEVAQEDGGEDCTKPTRHGRHEWYVDGPGRSFCRAYGARRTSDVKA